ncbi:MAG TPA: YfhO family protein [Thermoanaerobaculia bacterium]|nr:YfhO family protein [Thermoanaerobaculia bacterium]
MNLAWLYLGALYAIAVFFARRAGVDLPKRVALFFFAAVLLFFFAPLTQKQSNFHSDILKTIPPWYHVAPDRFAANTELNDVPLQQVPWAHQVRESWKSLRAPLWNHSAGSGYPLLANGQSSALSPIRIAALPLPLPQAMAAEAAMKLLIAITFTFLFCRGRGYSTLASVLGAVSFGFAGFLNTWLHFPHVTSACFLPAILYLVDRLALGWSRGAFTMAAIVWMTILFGGHPETASHIFFLALLYVLWIVLVEKRATWRLFLTLGGAMTIAALLAAPFLLPFLEALPRSQRYEALKTAPLDAQALPYTDFHSTIVLLQPHFFGRAPAERPWGPATTEPVGGFGGVLGIASFLALAMHVLWRKRWRSPEAFFVLATLLVFGVFQSWPFLGDIIHFVLPVVAHARFRLLFVMLLAIQSAAVFDLAQRGERKPLWIALGIVALMLLALLVFVHFPDDAKRITAMKAAIPSALVLLAAAFLPKRLRFVVILAVMFELASVTRGWNPAIPNHFNYPRTPLIRELMALRDRAREPFRVTAPGAPLFPNTGVMYGLEEVRAHDPMANARYLGFLALTAKYDPWNYHAMLPDPNAAVLDFLNVRYLVTDPNAEAPQRDRWKLVYDGPDGRIFENLRFLPRFFPVQNVIADFQPDSFAKRLKELTDWRGTAVVDELKLETPRMGDDFFKPRPLDAPAATSTFEERSPTDYRVHVNAPRWTLVVSSIPWWPGWTVTRNGEAIRPIRVNAAFLGFAVPPGTSDVRVHYRPRTWWIGLLLAALGIATLVAIPREGFARRRQRNFLFNRSRAT